MSVCGESASNVETNNRIRCGRWLWIFFCFRACLWRLGVERERDSVEFGIILDGNRTRLSGPRLLVALTCLHLWVEKGVIHTCLSVW